MEFLRQRRQVLVVRLGCEGDPRPRAGRAARCLLSTRRSQFRDRTQTSRSLDAIRGLVAFSDLGRLCADSDTGPTASTLRKRARRGGCRARFDNVFFFFPLSSRSPRFTFWRSANGAALAPGSQFRRGQAAGAGMPLTPSASPRSRTACLKSTRRSQRDAFPLRSPRLVVLASSQLLRTYLLLPRGNTARLALLHPPGNNPLEIMDVIGCRSSDGPQLHADHRTSTHSYSIALTCRNRLHPCTLCESCLLHYQHRGEGFVWSV